MNYTGFLLGVSVANDDCASVYIVCITNRRDRRLLLLRNAVAEMMIMLMVHVIFTKIDDETGVRTAPCSSVCVGLLFGLVDVDADVGIAVGTDNDYSDTDTAGSIASAGADGIAAVDDDAFA